MDDSVKQKIEKHFSELEEEIKLSYIDNLPFKDEQECMEWYTKIFDLIDCEEGKYKRKHQLVNDKRYVTLTAAAVRDFLRQRLLNEQETFNSVKFNAFILKNQFRL